MSKSSGELSRTDLKAYAYIQKVWNIMTSFYLLDSSTKIALPQTYYMLNGQAIEKGEWSIRAINHSSDVITIQLTNTQDTVIEDSFWNFNTGNYTIYYMGENIT